MVKTLLKANLTPRQREILECLDKNKSNVSKTAKKLNCERATVYNAINAATKKIENMRKNGLMELEKGISVPIGQQLTGTSRYHKLEDGGIWVKTTVEQETFLNALKETISELISNAEGRAKPIPKPKTDVDDMLSLYIQDDVHFGALMWGLETNDRDWDLDITNQTVRGAAQELTSSTPNSKYAIVSDLGDLMEIDDFKSQTPKSGNLLATDGRYPKVFKMAYMAVINLIDLALQKHEIVYFINIAGNHDISTGHAIREVISAWYRNEPRLICDESPSPIKYFQFGQTALMFAHGDGVSMKDAGEVLASDRPDLIASTKHRYAHFGHVHKDAIYDGRLCKSESHRNLAPLNDWASHKGYRRGLGTMKAITYHNKYGQRSTNLFSVDMLD